MQNETPTPDSLRAKLRRGFSAMSREKQRAIASMGGIAAHEYGCAHEFTPEQARIAGQLGGYAVSRDREHMARIGRAGGSARGKKQREQLVKPMHEALGQAVP